jgi:surfeit locus 1 family protein
VPRQPGSRFFRPSLPLTLVTLVVLGILVSLGRWQLRRADEKQRLFDAFAAGAGTTLPLTGATALLPRYQHVEAHGAYDPGHQVLIDNMTSGDGQAGYYVITPFALDGGGWLLVNRGWVPVGSSRRILPDVSVAATPRALRGRTDHLPVPGIHLGTPAPLAPPFPAVATYPGPGELAALLGTGKLAAAADVLLLDPAEPDGYLRQWSPPGLSPMRHLAYAVQWFGLALTLVIIYIVTNLRRSPLARASGVT